MTQPLPSLQNLTTTLSIEAAIPEPVAEAFIFAALYSALSRPTVEDAERALDHVLNCLLTQAAIPDERLSYIEATCTGLLKSAFTSWRQSRKENQP